MEIDFSKIPNDRPAAVHFNSLRQVLEFFREFSKKYPEKARSLDEDFLERIYQDYPDFCLNPYMDEPDVTMCYCELDYYLDEQYAIVEYENLIISSIDLPIAPSDMSLDFILGL